MVELKKAEIRARRELLGEAVVIGDEGKAKEVLIILIKDDEDDEELEIIFKSYIKVYKPEVYNRERN